jgi:hypothetical protein
MVDLNNLKLLTQELAEEIHRKESGQAFKYMGLLFDNIESYVAIIDKDCKILYLNPSAIRNYKDRVGKDIKIGDNCITLLQDNKDFCKNCLTKTCINNRNVLNEIIISPNTGIKYWRTCIPLAYDGVSGVIEILEKHND